jgi:signal transduction histidine kinase
VGGTTLLEYNDVLPHVHLIEPAMYKNVTYIAGIFFFFTCASYVMAYFSMSISRRLRRREDEITGLYQSVRAITSTLDLPQVLRRLTEATAQVLRCKAASIRLLDETASHLRMVTAYGLSEVYMEKAPIDLGRALIDQETLRGKTVLVRDALHDPRLRYPDKIRAEGIHTILSAPLMGKRGPIGVLRAYGGEGHEFTANDAAFLSTVARQGTVAIENAQAYDTLENLNREKSQFARIVTHELRSPVQVTQNLLGLLAKGYVGTLSHKQADLVDRVLRRIQFLHSLVDDLLDLAAGKTEVLAAADRGPVCLYSPLREICSRFEAQAKVKGLQLRVDCPQEDLIVWGDRSELDRIMNNLVGNAIKYTVKGEVRVLVEREGEFARITIADTGIGIPSDALPHIFDEFFRARNAKASDEGGTGLGLAIVKDLIRRYDGKIEVKSVEGQGTTFTLQLPVARQNSGASSDKCC